MDDKTLEGKILVNQDQFTKFANVFRYQFHAIKYNQLTIF